MRSGFAGRLKDMSSPEVVSRAEWRAAAQRLRSQEKALTAASDALAAERRRMPMVEMAGEWRFAGPDGPVSPADLSELGLFRASAGRGEPVRFALLRLTPGASYTVSVDGAQVASGVARADGVAPGAFTMPDLGDQPRSNVVVSTHVVHAPEPGGDTGRDTPSRTMGYTGAQPAASSPPQRATAPPPQAPAQSAPAPAASPAPAVPPPARARPKGRLPSASQGGRGAGAGAEERARSGGGGRTESRPGRRSPTASARRAAARTPMATQKVPARVGPRSRRVTGADRTARDPRVAGPFAPAPAGPVQPAPAGPPAPFRQAAVSVGPTAQASGSSVAAPYDWTEAWPLALVLLLVGISACALVGARAAPREAEPVAALSGDDLEAALQELLSEARAREMLGWSDDELTSS